uniref:Uncharacterized protein n=1 Tax=Arundo donax TaxID=35708 RepID=A0A0A9HDT5_ARUDO
MDEGCVVAVDALDLAVRRHCRAAVSGVLNNCSHI